MEPQDPLDVLRRRWHVLPPESLAQAREAGVSALERECGVTLPDDFRRYLLECAPDEEFWDEHHFVWWPIGRIRRLPDEHPYRINHSEIADEAPAYLVFADYMAWCWAWALCCSNGPNRGRVALIGEPDGFVASSFTDFVGHALRDDLCVHSVAAADSVQPGSRGP